MTDEPSEPTRMADEVTKQVIAALKPEFDQLRGEIRAAKRELGEQIDGLGAQQSAMQNRSAD